MSKNHHATARAPASIGNVGAGFDCLGQAFGALWDEVTASIKAGSIDATSVCLGGLSGLVTTLPSEVSRNTALRAAQAVLEIANASFSVRLDINKGIPLSAGLGGSAASAVAAVLAVNALLQNSLSQAQLFACALKGEAASANPPPPDNVAAALYGGLVLIGEGTPPNITPIPLPKGLVCLVFHPALKVNTEDARNLLCAHTPLPVAITQMRHMGCLIAGCFNNDVALIGQSLRDVMIEPQRAALVPAFADVKAAALGAGALGCCFSGSGPSIFAWAEADKAAKVRAAMARVFEIFDCPATLYERALQPCKAEVIS